MTLNIRDYLKIVNMNELRQVYKSQYGPCGEELHVENKDLLEKEDFLFGNHS